MYNTHMTLSLLTYNLLHNKALTMLEKVIEPYSPDILLLQEIDTSESNLSIVESLGYTLSDYANSYLKYGKVYGVATFYKNKKLIIVAGDFNYVYRRRRFEDIFMKYDLHEATNKIFITYKDRWLKIFPVKSKNDYVLYHNMVHLETKRIEAEYSDHYPVFSKFNI